MLELPFAGERAFEHVAKATGETSWKTGFEPTVVMGIASCARSWLNARLDVSSGSMKPEASGGADAIYRQAAAEVETLRRLHTRREVAAR